MAYGTLVTSRFFEEMSAFLANLQHHRGPIALAMMTPWLTSRDESWNLYLAADWLDEQDLFTSTAEISRDARNYLGSDASKYRGTWVTRTNQSLVEVITSSFHFPHPSAAYRIYSAELHDFNIDEAILFVANRAAIKSPQEFSISA